MTFQRFWKKRRAMPLMSEPLAATFLDFETSDYLDIVAYPNGVANPEVLIAHYSAPNDSTKYFVDLTHGGAHRLGAGAEVAAGMAAENP